MRLPRASGKENQNKYFGKLSEFRQQLLRAFGQ
jgi:hypothetical protein